MKRSTLLFTALAFALWAVPLFAQGRSGTHAAGPASGAGPSIGHGSTGTSSHGNPNISGGGGGSAAQTTQLNKVLGDSSTKLFSKISSLATADGTSITDLQSMGFQNLGQMMAALHVYKNLGLDPTKVTFSDFATYAKGHSLGAAIKKFDPAANSSSETKKGKKQANADVNEKES